MPPFQGYVVGNLYYIKKQDRDNAPRKEIITVLFVAAL